MVLQQVFSDGGPGVQNGLVTGVLCSKTKNTYKSSSCLVQVFEIFYVVVLVVLSQKAWYDLGHIWPPKFLNFQISIFFSLLMLHEK